MIAVSQGHSFWLGSTRSTGGSQAAHNTLLYRPTSSSDAYYQLLTINESMLLSFRSIKEFTEYFVHPVNETYEYDIPQADTISQWNHGPL